MNKNIDWIDKKSRLKKEICDYFCQINPDIEFIAEGCLHIKKWGQTYAEVTFEYPSPDLNTKIFVNETDDCVAKHFSPPHRKNIANWINRYARLTAEALSYLESQRTWSKSWARDDFEQEDFEMSLPDGEIQVYSDRLVLISFVFDKVFAKSLPQEGKKSIGELFFSRGGYEWSYPVSSLEQLKQITGFPVVYSIDFILGEK